MRIAAIPGDGIGAEVLPAAVAVIDAAVHVDGDSPVSWTWFDWGCDRFHDQGSMMPADGLQTLSEFGAIFLGAVGRPDVPDDVSLWGLLIPIRRAFSPVRQRASDQAVRRGESAGHPARRPSH
jgi:tartrate dehydrogenase/decarboxylase/D-malate dehydrogenase